MVWTCFASDNYTVDKAHLTHKYLGKLSDDQIDQTKKLLDSFFSNDKIESFSCLFDQEKFFGPKNDIRVLIPSNETELSRMTQAISKLAPTRLELDKIRKDDFSGFNPHITTQIPSIFLIFFKYCLVIDDRIIEYKFD